MDSFDVTHGQVLKICIRLQLHAVLAFVVQCPISLTTKMAMDKYL